MNNLIFNNVADLLKMSVYAENTSGDIELLQLDASNNLLVGGTVTVSEITGAVTIGNTSLTVAGTVTVSEITGAVTIGNTSLTVAGTVTVSEITGAVTIGNTSLTVAGTVTVSEITNAVTIGNTSLTVAGTVTVSEITNAVTIGNTSLTVAGTVTVAEITGAITIGASAFTSNTVSAQAITATGELFNNTDISTLKVASIFLYNDGATPITLSLQISPVNSDASYIDDASYTDQVLGDSASMYIPIANFAHYARIQYNMGASAGTITAYFNAQA